VLLLPQQAGAAQRAKGGRMRFHDKVALITAAASGIGRATADKLGTYRGLAIVALKSWMRFAIHGVSSED
jgi:hypothetical protein